MLEVLDTIETITGKPLKKRLCSRRLGDPAFLVANSKEANNILGWYPKYPNLVDIVQHAWSFFQKREIK